MFYDRLAPFYDLLAEPFEGPLRRELIGRLGVKPGDRVLDLGCGTGAGTAVLARAVGPAGKVVAIDASSGMLARATKRIAQEGLGDRVELKKGDAHSTSEARASFDAVLLCFTLELFSDDVIPIVLGECRRVLAPNGTLGVVALLAWPDFGTRLYGLAHRAFPSVLDCRPILLRPLLEAAGFRVTYFKAAWIGVSVGLAVASLRASQ